MPEMLEVELYRRSLEPFLGGRVEQVEAPDPWWSRSAPDVVEVLEGRRFTGVGRHGKVLVIHTDGPDVALRFGMTGRLLVDGLSGVESLVYGAHGADPSWERFRFVVNGCRVVVSDPRRLGRVEVDPVLDDLGPDAWGIDATVLAERIGASSAAVKVALLDQRRVSGLGNMLADEVLLRAGIHPRRACRTLTAGEWNALAAAIAAALPEMLASGGSHSGLLSADRRVAGAVCPLDGAPLERLVLGGRSAYACSSHQR